MLFYPPFVGFPGRVRRVIDGDHEPYPDRTVKVGPAEPRRNQSRADSRVLGVILTFYRTGLHSPSVGYRHPLAPSSIPRLEEGEG